MEVNCVRCARRTVETNNSGLMSREKQNMPAIYSSPGTRPIYFTLFSLHFSLLFLRAYFPFFLSLSLSLSPFLLYFVSKRNNTRVILTREQRNQLNRIIRAFVTHVRSSSFFYVIYMYIFLFIVWDSLWTLIREIKWDQLHFLFSSFI